MADYIFGSSRPCLWLAGFVPSAFIGLVASARSNASLSRSGICGYLSTLYPALVSISSRCLSAASLPLWLLSSSSITASTSKALFKSTKSARFCAMLFRLAPPPFGISKASNPISFITKYSGCGQTSVIRQNIDCSRGDAGLFFPHTFAPLCWLSASSFSFPFISTNAAMTPASTMAISKNIISVPSLFTKNSILAARDGGEPACGGAPSSAAALQLARPPMVITGITDCCATRTAVL